MCVAEVIAFADTEKRTDKDAPDWLLGSVDWNGRRVPVISLDGPDDSGGVPSGRRGSRSRIVIFHAIGELQKAVRETGPFVMIFQQTEVAGLRGNLQGYVLGPTFDTNFLAPVSKN